MIVRAKGGTGDRLAIGAVAFGKRSGINDSLEARFAAMAMAVDLHGPPPSRSREQQHADAEHGDYIRVID